VTDLVNVRRPLSVLVALMLALTALGVGSAVASAADPDGDGLTTSFETRWSHTDPTVADTDSDGTPDGQEDPDHDGLTNIWEQRLSLDPGSADSDGDGRSDGKEDADGDRLGNRFEVRTSHTDPLSLDSDRDGVRDGAEDPDKDQLSNAGEYRFETRPNVADSDGDGTDDWHDDADHDGIADGLLQDSRPVPSGLTPSLAQPRDRPASYTACHVPQGVSEPIVCRYGSTGPKVALFGDSHALQWRGPMERVADDRGWRLYIVTRSACPVARIQLPEAECAAWREQAITNIEALHPAMIVTSELDAYPVLGATDGADGDRLWRAGLISTLETLTGIAPRVVLLGDTPRWIDPITCLPEHLDDIAACAERRNVATHRDRLTDDRAAAKAAGVRYANTFPLTCPYDPCPTVIDQLLVAYDSAHMTYAFSRTLWRGLSALLPNP
jgi:SGNH domain (fused to AT3 domains)